MLFIEPSEFTRHLPSYLDDDSYAALQVFLAAHPDAGDIVRGTGGIRELRWRSKGRGKRGGSRIIYYWLVAEDHVYLLTLYGERSEGRPDTRGTLRVAKGRGGDREWLNATLRRRS